MADLNSRDESSNATEARDSLTPPLDLLVDEHEEEVSENGQTVRAQGDLAPIVFAPGAIDNNVALEVSPNHRMFIEEHLGDIAEFGGASFKYR